VAVIAGGGTGIGRATRYVTGAVWSVDGGWTAA
jgi:hypothetical protein